MTRYQSLDVLRALAVLLVLGHHSSFRFAPHEADPFAAVFKYTGWIGVDIFFVISGYLITRILLEQPYGLASFFRRRAYRILPLLFVAIAVFVVAALVTGTDRALLPLIWSPTLLLNGWTMPFYGYGNLPYTITWSLSVEETAYILLGLSSIGGLLGLRHMIYGMIIVAIAVRILAVTTGFVDLTDLYFFVPARLDAIAIGGLVALGVFDRVAGLPRARLLSVAAMSGLIVAYQFTEISDPFLPLVGYLVFSTTVAVLICTLVRPADGAHGNDARNSSVLWRWLVSFGKYSYFVYLFHIFVLEGLRKILPAAGIEEAGFWAAMVLTIIIVHLLAAFSWKYFEYPLIERGRRLPVGNPANAAKEG